MKKFKMIKEKVIEIKKRALREKVPIIMDDTLKEIEKILLKEKPKTILEIGTATRIFCYLFL